MDMQQLQIVAGSLSSLIFATATFNMLAKAWRTKDLSSYSISHVILNNIGNIIYWFYVVSLPIGPIYILHAFFTLACSIMLVWCVMYRAAPHTTTKVSAELARVTMALSQQIRQTVEFRAIRVDGDDC